MAANAYGDLELVYPKNDFAECVSPPPPPPPKANFGEQ